MNKALSLYNSVITLNIFAWRQQNDFELGFTIEGKQSFCAYQAGWKRSHKASPISLDEMLGAPNAHNPNHTSLQPQSWKACFEIVLIKIILLRIRVSDAQDNHSYAHWTDKIQPTALSQTYQPACVSVTLDSTHFCQAFQNALGALQTPCESHSLLGMGRDT